MRNGLVGQAAAPGISPLAAAPPNEPVLDLRGAKSRKLSERLIGVFLFLCGSLSIVTTIGIVFVLIVEAVRFFRLVSPIDFYTGTEWTALFDREFGVLPLVSGTLLIAVISMAVALPLGLMSAIFMSEYAPERARMVLKPTLEILAGVPTIVYGFFALTFITPNLLQPIFPQTDVFNALSAGIAVGIMILPMVASLSEDAMGAVPRALREGAYALGATKLEVSTRIVVPAALSGIFASFVLAISRAVGETMIVVVAAGARPDLVPDPFGQIQAMTSYIVAVISGDTSVGGRVYLSLFAVGATLFVMTLLLNIVSQRMVARFREVYQ